MILSRLTLNPRHRAVQSDLANPYELHRTLLSAFPADLPDRERILYRVDTHPRTGVPTVILQSHTPPDWAPLDQRDGYLLHDPETKTFDLAGKLSPGQALSFRLRANPTVKRQGSRHGLYKEEDQRAWLDRKGKRNGFLIVRTTVIPEGNVYAWKSRPNGQRRKLTFFAARFEGLLQVIDPDAVWDAVQTGVGPAKSFGFGLLSLAPASVR